MLSAVRKWGNSAAVRIPAAVLASAKLGMDDKVEVRAVDGTVVIAPARCGFDIDDMIDAITPDNRHEAVDWGPPVGKEVW